jgi:hypothetical protein
MIYSHGIIHARQWFHKWSSTLSDQIKKCYPHPQMVSQVNDTCYDIGEGAPPIGIKVKDPMWYLKSNHKVCHSNICGNVYQKCNIQVSTIYPNTSLCIIWEEHLLWKLMTKGEKLDKDMQDFLLRRDCFGREIDDIGHRHGQRTWTKREQHWRM